MNYLNLEILVGNPSVCVSLVAVVVQVIVRAISFFRERDFFSLYISCSYMGVELSIFALVTFIGIALSDGERFLSRQIPGGGKLTTNACLVVFFFLVLFYSVVVALTIFLHLVAAKRGRVGFSIASKAPAVGKMFEADIVSSMIEAVHGHEEYLKGKRSIAWGVACVALGLAAGTYNLFLSMEGIIK